MENNKLKIKNNSGIDQKQIKRLISAGYISCFLFLTLVIFFSGVNLSGTV